MKTKIAVEKQNLVKENDTIVVFPTVIVSKANVQKWELTIAFLAWALNVTINKE